MGIIKKRKVQEGTVVVRIRQRQCMGLHFSLTNYMPRDIKRKVVMSLDDFESKKAISLGLSLDEFHDGKRLNKKVANKYPFEYIDITEEYNDSIDAKPKEYTQEEIEEVKKRYLEVTGKKVSTKFSKNVEWMNSKIEEELNS